MVKAVLRKVLPAKEVDRLRKIKVGVRAATGFLWSGLCKVMPDRLVLFLGSHTKLIKRLDYPGSDILLHIESDIEYVTRAHSCMKEPETIEWIHSLFREGDVYYDIGANVGAYALVAAKHFKGRVRVLAFEPSFSTFKQLCANVFLNHCEDTITPLQVALSDKTSLENMNYSTLNPGGALHALGEAVDYKGEQFQPIVRQPVLAYSLDDLIRSFNLPMPNHVKLDVDGLELKILTGANKTLSNPLVKSVLLEVVEGESQSEQIVACLSGHGLKLQSKHKYLAGGDIGPSSRIYNYIFRR